MTESKTRLAREAVLEICGREYQVRIRPGQGIAFRPDDFRRLFPGYVPYRVLSDMADQMLKLLEREGQEIQDKIEEIVAPPKGINHFLDVIESTKAPETADDPALLCQADRAERSIAEAPDDYEQQVVEIDSEFDMDSVNCPYCEVPHEGRGSHYVGGEDMTYKVKCHSCKKTYGILDLHQRELRKCYKSKFKGPDPEKISCFYSDEGFKLSEEQHEAIKQVMLSDKRVTIVTGLAGAGKSVIIRTLQRYYSLTTTATTGKAALNVDGMTIDSLTSLNRDDWKVRNPGSQSWAMDKATKKIIIDECSMIGHKMGDFLANVAEDYDRQWILFGDYGQASPVKDGCVLKSTLLDDYDFVKLIECHRQSEGPFLEALNKVRIGELDDQVAEVFQSCVMRDPPEDDKFIRMFATNKATNNYNFRRLQDHCRDSGHPAWGLTATWMDKRSAKAQGKWPRDHRYIQRKIEDSSLAHDTNFALGCQVVFTVNETGTEHRRYVNGDTGEILQAWAGDKKIETLDLSPFGQKPEVTKILVRVNRNGAEVMLEPIVREFLDSNKAPESTVRGFPFKLGYALTIHKAQGMTVDMAWVDMGTIMAHPEDSRYGLAYVALSRTRTLEGLKISRWVPDAIKCNQELLKLM